MRQPTLPITYLPVCRCASGCCRCPSACVNSCGAMGSHATLLCVSSCAWCSTACRPIAAALRLEQLPKAALAIDAQGVQPPPLMSELCRSHRRDGRVLKPTRRHRFWWPQWSKNPSGNTCSHACVSNARHFCYSCYAFVFGRRHHKIAYGAQEPSPLPSTILRISCDHFQIHFSLCSGSAVAGKLHGIR